MAKLELQLLENATDSLNEALVKFREGDSGNVNAYKFAILHFSHFMELMFKYYVAQSHPLLIYRDPFHRNIRNSSTIGLWDAVQFFKNDGHQFPKAFIKDLEWFKDLRNDIEHFQFKMDADQVRQTLGRLMMTFHEFHTSVSEIDLREHLDSMLWQEFTELADGYEIKMEKAREFACKRNGGEEYLGSCSHCQNALTLSYKEGIYHCHYCDIDLKEVVCSKCKILTPELISFSFEDSSVVRHPLHEQLCADCLHETFCDDSVW